MTKFLPGCSNSNSSIQKAVEVCKNKIGCFKKIKEQLSKRRLGAYLTDQLKISSKDLMGTTPQYD